MTTQDMSIAQLWKAHFASPNNTVIRNAIATRDPGGVRQLQPISRPCNVSESARLIADAEERAEEAESESKDAEELESKLAVAEDKIEKLVEAIDEARQNLATAIQ